MFYPTQDGELQQLVVDAHNTSRDERLQNKLAIFGSGSTEPNGYYAIGPHASLVGRKVSELSLLDSDAGASVIAFEQRNIFADVDIDSEEFIPIYVSGKVLNRAITDEKVHLAVVVNGTVQAVTQTYVEASGMTPRFYAMLPEDALRMGRNEIDFYWIAQDDDETVYLSLAPESHQ